jgi:cell division protein FtsA
MVQEEEGVSVPAVAGGSPRVVPRREICEILQPRAEELVSLVREDLGKNGWDGQLRGGIVLTGGGAQLDGLLELCGQAFNASVRYGLPHGLGGLVDVINSPGWSTAAGLLHYAVAAEQNHDRRPRRGGFSVRGVMGSLRNVFSDLL